MRPSDWFLVELPGDPTPGDVFGIRALAAKYAAIAEIALEASDGVHRARSSGAASAWIGEAGEIFREKSHRMPGELAKANDSYSVVAQALTAWAAAVDDTQAQADRGLQQAPVTNGTLKAIHAASADPAVLSSVFQREYKDVISVNAANFWKGVEVFDANCTRCVIATDHTIGGARSSAMPVLSNGDSPAVIAEHFGQTITDFTHKPGYDSIVQDMTNLGEGARGIVLGDRGPNMVGHVFNVVHDSNGIVFIDGQVGQFAHLEDFKNLFLLITKG